MKIFVLGGVCFVAAIILVVAGARSFWIRIQLRRRQQDVFARINLIWQELNLALERGSLGALSALLSADGAEDVRRLVGELERRRLHWKAHDIRPPEVTFTGLMHDTHGLPSKVRVKLMIEGLCYAIHPDSGQLGWTVRKGRYGSLTFLRWQLSWEQNGWQLDCMDINLYPELVTN